MYQKLLEENLIISTSDSNGIITYVNEKFCDVSGYNRKELIGQKYQLLKSTFHTDSFFRNLWADISSGKTWQGTICNTAKGGAPYYTNTIIVPELDYDGSPICFHSFGIHSSEKISESEHTISSSLKLKAFTENSNDYHLFLSPTFEVLSLNDAFASVSEKLTGRNLNEGDNILHFGMEEIVMNFQSNFNNALAGKNISEEQLIGSTTSEAGKWFSLDYKPVYDSTTIIGVSLCASEIHEWKHAEHQLKKSEQKFRALLENNMDVIVVLDRNLNISFVSTAVKSVMGFTPEEIIGKPAVDFYHEEDKMLFSSFYQQAMDNPGKSIFYPSRLRHKDGHYIWAEGTITNLYDNENVKGMVGNFRNVSVRKEYENKIAEQSKQLSEIAKIQSHQIRGPLTKVLGLASIYNHKNPADPLNKEILEMIEMAAKSLDKMIHEVVGRAYKG